MEDDKSESSFTRRLVGRIPDVMGRALVAGTGALFLTEEGIRNVVSDLKLPGEVVRVLVQQAEGTKKELFRLVGQEIRSFLEQSNLSQELAKLLASVTVDIHTTIRFLPDEAGDVSPRFKVSTEITQQGDPPGEGGGQELDEDQDQPQDARPGQPVPADEGQSPKTNLAPPSEPGPQGAPLPEPAG